MACTIFEERPSRLAMSAPMRACGPSTSWSTALPMSCKSPAVLQELIERAPGDFASHRIEGRDRHCLGRVVDDQVDASGLLERTDITALTPDDAALHIIRREWDDRD